MKEITWSNINIKPKTLKTKFETSNLTPEFEKWLIYNGVVR